MSIKYDKSPFTSYESDEFVTYSGLMFGDLEEEEQQVWRKTSGLVHGHTARVTGMCYHTHRANPLFMLLDGVSILAVLVRQPSKHLE